jgi:hypothetical protein
MSVNNDKLAQIFALLLDDGSSAQQQEEQQEQQEQEQEQQKPSEEKPKEKPKEKSNDDSEDNSEDDSGSGEKYDKVDEELRKKIDNQFAQVASSHIVSETAGIGLDNENVKNLLQFVNYDTMKNENGDLDEDKASSLVTVISNISLRKPPSSGASQSLSRSQRGMGKYLKN